jgi:thymidylate kinase
MIIVLNGPLGIGKSTLAEALGEAIDRCVMLDGDHVVALNPPPEDEVTYLHDTLALLVAHHACAGYRHVVINHYWSAPAQLDDLRARLHAAAGVADVRCFLLTLPEAENLRRIAQRQQARALDEAEFERETVAEERAVLYGAADDSLGEPFDVSAPPEELVARMLRLLRLD